MMKCTGAEHCVAMDWSRALCSYGLEQGIVLLWTVAGHCVAMDWNRTLVSYGLEQGTC
jgi:hypothetical protein